MPDVKVVLDISPDSTGGWQTTNGTLAGDPAALSAAFENNREAELIHDATGFHMHLTIQSVTKDGLAYVTVDASK